MKEELARKWHPSKSYEIRKVQSKVAFYVNLMISAYGAYAKKRVAIANTASFDLPAHPSSFMSS